MLVVPKVQQALTLSKAPKSVSHRCKPAEDLASLVSMPEETLVSHLGRGYMLTHTGNFPYDVIA